VEYVSVLAQAQRLVATGSLERLAGFVGEVAGVWPEARHKIDATQAVDDFAEALGVNPKIVRSDKEVEALVQAEQQAAANAQAAEQGANMVDMAKTASDTNMEGDNALTTMLRNAGVQ
jgi:hypothetical protein